MGRVADDDRSRRAIPSGVTFGQTRGYYGAGLPADPIIVLPLLQPPLQEMKH